MELGAASTWAAVLDEDGENTPLTPQHSPDNRRSSARLSATSEAMSAMPSDAMQEAAREREGVARLGADQRRSKLAYLLLALFFTIPLLDFLLFLELVAAVGSVSDLQQQFGDNTKTLAQVAQLLVTIFTLLLSAWSLAVHRRWQISLPRNAAAAAHQFSLLPEYSLISLILDVGKLAFPAGSRVALVSLLMFSRLTAIAVLLRVSFIAGVRRGLVSQRYMPEMLRTLVSLEGVEARGLGDIAPQSERPLSVDLLEKLIVFLTPRRLGERPKEGAGLARNSAMPLTTFALLLTLVAAATEYERLRSSQEPSFEAAVTAVMRNASEMDLGRLNWRKPASQPVPPVSTFLVIVSGVNEAVGSKILANAFDPAVNQLCALPQSRCDAHTLRSVAPSTSLPNWIAALTGASPTITGVLGNYALGPFPFDSVFAQAKRHSVPTGVSASPWLVNPIKKDLPLLTGDGRTTSSADGVYETTFSATTEPADSLRRETTLVAVSANRASLPDNQRTSDYPPKYPLFVTQLTAVDTVGHRKGAASQEYEDAITVAATFIKDDLMAAMPPNSVLIVVTDHGHEQGGGAGGTSDAVSRTPMYTYRKTVAFGASNLELQALAAALAATKSGSAAAADAFSSDDGDRETSILDAEISMLDLAPTLCLLAGLPVPRHAEGGFIPRMFANARRELWPAHARDLLYQRYHYAKTLIDYETLDTVGRLRSLEDLELDAVAQIAEGGGTPLEQAVAWLEVAGEVQAAIDDARGVLKTRYSLRNLLVSAVLGLLLLALFAYVLHVMTFADPFFVLTYRKSTLARRGRARSFWRLPDVVAMQWAIAVVGAYYFIAITTYLALLQGLSGYSAFDASHVHDTFSQRRYFLATLFPGLVAQWALTRSFTIYYKTPFVPPPQQPSVLLKALRYVVKVRLIFSAQVESRAVAKVYLIRLYIAALAVFATVVIFVASSGASFPLPYMFQPKHIDRHTWDARFQTLTYKMLSLPLLLGAMYNLYLWGGTRLTVAEVDALYKLKRIKEARLLGAYEELEKEEEAEIEADARAKLGFDGGDGEQGTYEGIAGPGGDDPWLAGSGAAARREEPTHKPETGTAAEEEIMLRQLVRRKQGGEVTVESLSELEQLLRRARTVGALQTERLEEMQRKLDRQENERSEAVGAVRSSKAFLGRGFRDIEMLLEAGFRELEDQRSSFMANRRKKLRQRIERDRARRAQRSAGYAKADGGGGPGSPTVNGAFENDGQGGEDAALPEGESSSDDSDGESLASFDSEALASMDYDEIQARLAANEAKERKHALFATDEPDQQAGVEAADIRRTEFASLAQSKMGKQAQLDELTARLNKEQQAAAQVRERLEAAMADEQAHLQEWEKVDGELQEAELERATAVAQRTKAKELALEKAQVAESSLEELKEKYRELRRREEKMLRAVRDAEAGGEQQARELDLQAESLRHSRYTWTERITAADEDRKALFGEAQRIEQQLREEKARKAEAQAQAAHYRELLRTQM